MSSNTTQIVLMNSIDKVFFKKIVHSLHGSYTHEQLFEGSICRLVKNFNHLLIVTCHKLIYNKK